MPAVDPTPEQIARLTATPDTGPVVMINLLAFRPDGGLTDYERYAMEVLPHLERAGGTLLYAGAARQVIIGDSDPVWWDSIAVVQYPSIAAFLGMVTNPDYLAISAYRTRALRRAELIATAPGALSLESA